MHRARIRVDAQLCLHQQETTATMTSPPPIPLIGYTDRLSGRAGDVIAFKVSSRASSDFEARLVRVICADPNPAGQGIVEEEVAADFAGSYPSREQPFYPGSYVSVDQPVDVQDQKVVRLEATIWPTKPGRKEQVIISLGPLSLMIDETCRLCAQLNGEQVRLEATLAPRTWYRVWLVLDQDAGELKLGQQTIATAHPQSFAGAGSVNGSLSGTRRVSIAASLIDGIPTSHFNGKIEAPAIYGAGESDPAHAIARWDFARQISSTTIEDAGPNAYHGRIVNLPARAMTGSNWDATEMCWRHAPEHYGAIHFHESDIYDFAWETDFTFTVPDDLPSGVYAARITCGDAEDAMPFFVCPPRGKRHADLCVLVSTFTYTVYGNHARPDFTPAWQEAFAAWNAYPWNPAAYKNYGLSTYNYHTDGSGICHASHRRPLFNLRPAYRTYAYGEGSGLRHFQADSHLISWLHDKGIAYDIVTDQELHEEGYDAIKGYKAVTTGSHPEYHTKETLDALTAYRDNGGNLAYLGGNGFYWRVAIHPEHIGAIEIRRAETGIRAWAAEPGEYYNAFDGAYGGIWRRSGRPPQQLAGVGFSAQGQFEGSYYRRRVDGSDADVGWIVKGIDDEILGDFGYSGGGAAGFELDRADERLGTPANARVIASSENHGESFVLVPEEHLTHITNLPGEPVADLLRADMIYFEVPGGGSVFSTGSITFCGSLPWNNFDNNISKLLHNVFQRFLGD